MTKEKTMKYKKAYTQLSEIFKILEKEQLDKIPVNFKNNIINNMDKDYEFVFDKSKGIFEQELMVETQALLVEIYEKYLAPAEEKEMWEKYDRFCLNKIDDKKRRKYDVDAFKGDDIAEKQNSLIKNKETSNNKNKFLVEAKKENVFAKIVKFIKNLFG